MVEKLIVKWVKPEAGHVRLNVDASYHREDGDVATGQF